MPELPEVETTIRFIRPELVNRVIKDITVTNKGESTFNIPFEKVKEKLVGQSLFSLDRTGKWMLFTFSNNEKAIGHLRMSGRYKVADEVLDLPHNRFQIHLDNGKVINYLDQRRFGTFHFVNDFKNHSGLAALGPDVLTPAFTPEYLHQKLSKLKKPIYSALLDQSVIAGLGNIYVNEVLNAAKIHPLMPANKVTLSQTKDIVKFTQDILGQALILKGTTLIDNLYQNPEGKSGQFYKMLKVYGKKSDPDIKVIKIGGRSAFVHKDTPLV